MKSSRGVSGYQQTLHLATVSPLHVLGDGRRRSSVGARCQAQMYHHGLRRHEAVQHRMGRRGGAADGLPDALLQATLVRGGVRNGERALTHGDGRDPGQHVLARALGCVGGPSAWQAQNPSSVTAWFPTPFVKGRGFPLPYNPSGLAWAKLHVRYFSRLLIHAER